MDESNSPKFNWKSQLKAIPPLTLKTGLSGLTFPEIWDHYIPVCGGLWRTGVFFGGRL